MEREVTVQVTYCVSVQVKADVPEPDEHGYMHLDEKQEDQLITAIEAKFAGWRVAVDGIDPEFELDWISTYAETEIDGTIHQIAEWD